jgi:hypothetical protein
MSGSIPFALVFLGGILALCWADLGKKMVDAENEAEAIPETETRIEQRYRQADGQ